MRNLLKIAGVILMIISLNSCLVISTRNNDAYFDADNTKGAKFTTINLPTYLIKPFLGKTFSEDDENLEVKRVLKKIRKVKITTVQNASKAMLNDYRRYLDRNHFTDWVTIQREGQRINIQAQQKGDDIKNLILQVTGDQEMVFINIKGLFSPDDVSKLISEGSSD